MVFRFCIVLALFVTACVAQPVPRRAVDRKAFFARYGANFWQRLYGGSKGLVRVQSPDGQKTVTARLTPKSDVMEVLVTAFGKEFPTEIGNQVNCEVLWAPDSRAFFVTWSESGLVGFYRVDVYIVDSGAVRRVELIRTYIDRAHRAKRRICECDEDPNVVAVD